MVTQQIIISTPGTGTISNLSLLARAAGSGYCYRYVSAYEDWLPGGEDPLGFLHNGELDELLRRSPSLVLVLDGLRELTPIRRNMLATRIKTWSEHNRDLPIKVFWTVVEQNLQEAQEIAGDILFALEANSSVR